MKWILFTLLMTGGTILPVPMYAQQVGPDPLDRSFIPSEIVPSMEFSAERGKGPMLTLGQAVRTALSKNRELTASLSGIQGLKGARIQAGLLPDPELTVEMENVAGTGGYADTGLAETTIAFEQLIELGGKRKKRFRIADAELQLAKHRYQSLERRIVSDITSGFFEVLAAQKRITISEEIFRMAEIFHRTVRERVKAGKVSPVEETRASVVLCTARIRRGKARRDLANSRTRLAAAMGADIPVFGKAEGDLSRIVPVPETSELEQLLNDNPELLRWNAELERSRTSLSLAKAGRVPDLSLSAGFRKFRETDDSAYVIGISLRLPLWNRNRGKIIEAHSRAVQVKEKMAFSTIDVKREFRSLCQDLLAAVNEVRTIQTAMLPASRSAFEAVQMGYREGKFGFIEVLDAQRTYFDVEMQYVDALEEYQTMKARVEEMIGQKIEGIERFGEKTTGADIAGGTE